MAQGFFKFGTGAVTSVARPTEPTIGTATTSAETTDVVVTFTPSVFGPAATSYVVTGTTTTATAVTSITQTTTGTSVTMVGNSGGASYTYSVRPQNANGLASRSSSLTGAAAVPIIYALALTANTTQNYTIPSGKSFIGAIVYGGGASGTAGGNQNASPSWHTGTAGSSGGAVAFSGFAVTAGQELSIVIGGASGTSSIITSGTTIATATGGVGLTSPGTASSNVSGHSSVSGVNGGASGVAGTTNTAYMTITGTGIPNSIQGPGGGGGGVGGGGHGNGAGSAPAQHAGGAAGGGAGVRGVWGNSGSTSIGGGPLSSNGTNGGGGGGGAGGGYNVHNWGPSGGAGGGTGSTGTVYIYTA
jgi:hypothetical protein